MDISIIIPIYNVETYLGSCLDSVKEMGEQLHVEILLIDDGSTDNSSVIAKEYADKYSYFYYHRQENRGLSCARNYGVSLAKGKYLMFVDSDDMIDAKVYVRMFQAAQKNQTELTICDVVRVRDKKITPATQFVYAFHNLDRSVTHITKHANLVYDTPAWNKLILRSFYEKYQFVFLEGYFYEDAPWSIALHYYANAVTVLNEVGYYWRVRTEGPPSITQLKSEKKNLCDLLEMLEKRFDFVEKNVKNKKIFLELERKTWRLTFMGYIGLLQNMDKEKAEEYLELIAQFVEKRMSREGYESLPVIHQQLIQTIIERNMGHLLRVYNYKKKFYKTALVIDEGTEKKLLLPDEIFTISNRDAKKEFCINPPRCQVDAVQVCENEWVLDCHLYHHKLSVAEGEQRVQAFLYHLLSGERIKVPTTSIVCHRLTKVQEAMGNYYNYDGTGFQIKLDFSKLERKKIEEGLYKILIKYKNATVEGKRILRGIKETQREVVVRNSFRGRKMNVWATLDVRDTIQFQIEKTSMN